MASSLIKKPEHCFGELETLTFPFTADKDGIVIAVISPPQNTASYVYIAENGGIHARGYSAGGTNYTMVFPVRKDKAYSISASSNYSFSNGVRFFPL